MTRDRDIERVLERWLTEGPTQMPDHLFDVVVDRIDRVPQRRLARLVTRFAAMNLNARIAAAAAIIVAVAGVSAFALSGSRDMGVGPSPAPIASSTPTITPSQSPSAPPLAIGLRYRWIGETRSVPALVPGRVSAGLLLASASLRVVDANGSPQVFVSTASTAGSNQVRFVLSIPSAGCGAGDVGTYASVLSPGGGSLSLTAIEDACAARSQAISGDWVRSDCPDPNSVCLGELEAGEHTSAVFNPFVPVKDYVYAYGRVSYTVPSGWTNTVDGANGYILAQHGAPKDAAIYLFSTALADSQASGCPGTIQPGVGHTASALATWLTTLPGLVTTKPVSVSLGGLHGMTLDVSVAPTWARTCPYSNGKPYVAMFTNGQSENNFDWGLTAGAGMRLFLLDLPDGRTLLIDVEAQDQATWDALVHEAMPIVQSFQFNH
jgi:hypothetical protein